MIKLLTALIVLALSMVSCNGSSSTSYKQENEDGKVYRKLSVDNKNTQYEVEIAGSMAFNDSETAIVQLSDGGYANYTEGKYKLQVANKNAHPYITLHKKNIVIAPESAEGQTIIKEAITKFKAVQDRKN